MRRLLAPSIALVSMALAACNDQPGSPVAPQLSSIRASARAKAPTPPAPNVTSTVYDRDNAGSPLITGSDDYNGTGFATYTAVSGVTSQILADGGWQLYLGSQSVRKLHLLLASQGMPIPDGSYSANVEAYSKCFNQSNVRVSMLAMAAGTSNTNCSFGVDFAVGSTKYKLAMSPIYAGTGRAMVSCTAASGGYCTSWTISNAADAHVANLYHFAKNGSLVLDGVYHGSYSVSLKE